MPKLTIHKTIDVPEFGSLLSMDEIVALSRESGSHFFDRDTMRCFKSRLYSHVWPVHDGWLFITSEQMDRFTPRRFTVRKLTITEFSLPVIYAAGQSFGQHASLRAAWNAAKKIKAADDEKAGEPAGTDSGGE